MQYRDAKAALRTLTEVHERLMDAAGHDLSDFFEFTIPPARHELTAAPGGGGVFNVIARVAGGEFARFHIDIGFGDVVFGEPGPLPGDDLLAFAEIPPPMARAISKAQQFAEKIHAYTFPWEDRENTRSRDLVNMVLLIERGELDPDAVRHAVVETFMHRQRQAIPLELAPPPRAWAVEFPTMSPEAGNSTTDIDQAFAILDAFWNRLRPRDRSDA